MRRLALVLATVLALVGCGHRPAPVPPPPPKQHIVQVQVTPEGALQSPNVVIELEVDLHGLQPCVTEGVALTCALKPDTPVPFGAHLRINGAEVNLQHFKPYNLDVVLQDVPYVRLPDIELEPTTLPRAQWARDYRSDIHMAFSGETICTTQYGCRPWFEPAYQTLTDPQDRASVRQQKRDKYGDTHIILECFTSAGSIYNESDVWLQVAVSRSCEQEPEWFKGLVDEVLGEGGRSLVPILVYDGDNASEGHRNALRQLPFLSSLFAGYDDSVVWARFWDGVFYGSTPDEIRAFGTAFRALHGDTALLAIEHQPGRIPSGLGQRDYQGDGNMAAYDIVVGEFSSLVTLGTPPPIVNASFDPSHGYVPVFATDASGWMNVWQILARTTVGYRPPANQPFNVSVIALDGPQAGQRVSVSSDRSVPARDVYLIPSSRGPRRYWTFEDGEYEWVRGRVSFADLQRVGNYYRATGATNVCLP
jgi:hypothetical protein